MKFHPQKCKILSITHKLYKNIPPFDRFPYCIGDDILDYCSLEKDLGIIINVKLNFNQHCSEVLSTATNKFNILRRTCHFIKNKKKKRTLYLTLVRSIFEHGSVIWAPSVQTTLDNFEALQKRCVKWIMNQQYISYNNSDYILKLKDLDILPIKYKLMLTDLITFHKIINKLILIDWPNYLVRRRNSRAFENDSLAFEVNSTINNKKALNNSFFVRNLAVWNSLSPELKTIKCTTSFALGLRKVFWKTILDNIDLEPDNIELEPD